MDTRVARSILPVLVGYRNNLVTCKLMTSQVAQCLLLQMSTKLDFSSERVKIAQLWTEFQRVIIGRDSLFHSFLDCQTAVDFFRKVLCWFNQKENTSIDLNTQEILFGVVTNKDRKLKELNFCLLYAKFYLHFEKINLRECNWETFVRKLNFLLKIEGFL